ncbi:MAG: VOC family protein [Sphingobacteriaceae bacterium]|jgi:predicted enzyme related to lactoylglutathione lyase|nr:MAG: VOC family protein [Pedobacter sp.]
MNKEQNTDPNAIVWFEIPASDITRATKFYETVLNIKLESSDMMGMKMAIFPNHGGTNGIGGALVQSQVHKPSDKGTVIYLNASPNLQVALDRVEKAGGKVTMPKTLIDEKIGYMAFFIDTEGNNMALHSTN